MVTAEKDYRKPCTLCETPRDVLVRCQIDESGTWHFVCPGSCWKRVSGGVIDGDKSQEHSHYRYGGMWKNKHEAVSAKKPKPGSKKQLAETMAGTHEEAGDSGVTRGDEDVSCGDQDAKTLPSPHGTFHDLPAWREDYKKYAKNDRVVYQGEVWICRKSHASVEGGRPPDKAQSLWKEQKGIIQDPD
jgi:hypothetical protein